MYAFGFLGLVIGAYLIDCAFKGRPPITTFKMLLAHPSEVESVLRLTEHTIGNKKDDDNGDDIPDHLTSGGGGGSF